MPAGFASLRFQDWARADCRSKKKWAPAALPTPCFASSLWSLDGPLPAIGAVLRANWRRFSLKGPERPLRLPTQPRRRSSISWRLPGRGFSLCRASQSPLASDPAFARLGAAFLPVRQPMRSLLRRKGARGATAPAAMRAAHWLAPRFHCPLIQDTAPAGGSRRRRAAPCRRQSQQGQTGRFRAP